jgi:hypothetical protein
MKKPRLIFVFISLVGVLFLVAQYYKPAAINWSSTLLNFKKAPFDTYILYHRIGDIFPGANISTSREPVYNTLSKKRSGRSTYIIICNAANVDKRDFDKLEAFIKKGNDVIIAANSLGYIEKKLRINSNFEFNLQKPVKVNFLHQDVKKEHFIFDREVTNGYYGGADSSRFELLGENEKGNPNFIQLKMGKGSLYLCANPLLFTNYSLVKDDGARYAALALSHSSPKKEVIWDEYYTQGRKGQESFLRVFLEHPPLRWAAYIALISLAVFVIYQSKRRQAAIPVIDPPANSSVEFATVVGQVYYEQHNNSNIALKKVTYFLEHIRTKYFIRTNLLNDEFVSLLAHKSGVSRILTQELAHQIILVRNGHELTDSELMTLNHHIEQFYIQTR